VGRWWQEEFPKHQKTSSGALFSAAQAKTSKKMLKSSQNGSEKMPKWSQKSPKGRPRNTSTNVSEKTMILLHFETNVASNFIWGDTARLADGGVRGGLRQII